MFAAGRIARLARSNRESQPPCAVKERSRFRARLQRWAIGIVPDEMLDEICHRLTNRRGGKKRSDAA